MNNENTSIGTLKRSFSSFATGNHLIAAGCLNILEIWHIHIKFKFKLLKLHSRNFEHFMEITSVRFISDHLVITTSKDYTP